MAETKHMIGISSFTFPFACGTHAEQKPLKPFKPLDIIRKAVQLKADCVQYGDNMPLEDLSEKDLLTLRKEASESGITLEMGMREAKAEKILRYIRIADLTGARLIRCILDGKDGSYEPDEKEVCENIQKVLPSLREKNIILGIENHDRISADDYAGIIRRINDPHVGLVVDTTNSLSTEEPVRHVLEKMAPYCVSLHIKDYKIHRANSGMGLIIVGECPGKGRQNIPYILKEARKLADRDFSIILESWMEPCSTLEETLRQENDWAAQGIQYLKSLL